MLGYSRKGRYKNSSIYIQCSKEFECNSETLHSFTPLTLLPTNSFLNSYCGDSDKDTWNGWIPAVLVFSQRPVHAAL